MLAIVSTGPQHGSVSGYLHIPCSDEDTCPARITCNGAKRAAQKRYRAKRPGKKPDPSTRLMLDGTPVREHLDMLRKAGVGWLTIQQVSGIHNRTLRRIASGQHQRVLPRTAQAIFAVHRYHARGGVPVPAEQFHHLRQRLQEDLGWTRKRVMAEAGLTHGAGYGTSVSARAAHAMYRLAWLRLPGEALGNPW